jgi:MoxR-like ATPases
LSNYSSLMRAIVGNIEKVIIGKHNSVVLAVIALCSGGHVLIEDPPGVGKTSLAAALAKSVDGSFKRIQFTSDILPSDITGFSMYNQKYGEFEFKQGAVMSQFVLADEINRTSPKTQASLLEVMEEKQVTVDGQTHSVPLPFMVLATQNPIDYLGTFPLPEAQLDRFMMKISLGYPDFAQEVKMLSRFKAVNPLEKLYPVATDKDILDIQKESRNIFVHDLILNYLMNIIHATRQHKNILLGVSPRASLSLFNAARALALYNDRTYCIPEDVKRLASPVLAHRLILNQESSMKNITKTSIINEVVDSISVPSVS